MCRLLEPLRPMFVEEPVVPELTMDLARVCASTSIPVATGGAALLPLGLPTRLCRRDRRGPAGPVARGRGLGVP
ncbi:MAG: hypothetical protein WCG47_04875, partial [Dermatophilaceae bacterium]